MFYEIGKFREITKTKIFSATLIETPFFALSAECMLDYLSVCITAYRAGGERLFGDASQLNTTGEGGGGGVLSVLFLFFGYPPQTETIQEFFFKTTFFS